MYMNQVQISKILVCIDGSELSKQAGTLAISVAKRYQSKSYALSAYNVPDLHDLYSERKNLIHSELEEKIKKANNNGIGVEKNKSNLSHKVFSVAFLNQNRSPSAIAPIFQKTRKIKTYPREALWSRLISEMK